MYINKVIAKYDSLSKLPPSFHLPVFSEILLKIQFKEPALPCYLTCSLSIIMLDYLLAFVKLTWQVENV